MIVYKITNKINNKIYIGQTIRSLEERWRGHWKERRSGRYICNALQKYGKSNFSIQIMAYCDNLEALNSVEKYMILKYKSQYPFGYNILAGGKNAKHTEETKKKMSDMAKGRKSAFKGKKHSKATKDLIRKSRLGKSMNYATKNKIKHATTGIKNHFFGKKHSNETRAKISKLKQERDTLKRQISNG